ncbi:MAG: hypothetical protein ACLSGI_12380 [Butyricicoccaceae bacterium]
MPALNGQCETASVMAFGFDPYFTEQNPYLGASSAVIESVAKLVAAGCDFETAYSPSRSISSVSARTQRFGKPLSALLGAYTAQRTCVWQPSAARTPCRLVRRYGRTAHAGFLRNRTAGRFLPHLS